MAFGNPLILALFFGIFHFFGGLAVGKGLRERTSDKKVGSQLIAWGMLMGATPTLFDWFFLIRLGAVIWGFVGPAIFIAAVILGVLILKGRLTRRNEKSLGAVLMGGSALMLGLLLTPYLIEKAQVRKDIGFTDYVCGGAIPLMFIFIGASFAWNGISALRKNMSFDEFLAERQIETGEKPGEKE